MGREREGGGGGEREVRGREGYGEGKRGCEVRGVKEGEVTECKR